MSEKELETVTEEVETVAEASVEEKQMESVLIDHTLPVMTVKKLLEAGAHFGHQTRRWNPKMKPYIFCARNGIYVIDLVKTSEKIIEAYAALKKIVEEGGKVIFVGTKKNAQEFVQEEANRSGSFYATTRWLGGTLTNFRTIQSRIKYLRDIETMEKDGTFALLPKKEVANYYKEKANLEKNLGGIKEMRRIPQAMFVVDPTIEINAVREARKLHIPVFGIVDTNSDPDLVDYVIPANDDSNKAVKLILQVMADAVVEAKGGDMSQILVAYTKDECEANMDDVIANADAAEKERQARRAAEAAARKAAMEKAQANRFKKPGRTFTPKTTSELKETPKQEEKVEEVKEEVVAKKATAKKAEVKEEVKVEEVKEEKVAAKKTTAKKVEEVKEEKVAEEKKPAAKKTTAKKAEVKEEASEEKKPAAKKTTTKKVAEKAE